MLPQRGLARPILSQVVLSLQACRSTLTRSYYFLLLCCFYNQIVTMILNNVLDIYVRVGVAFPSVIRSMIVRLITTVNEEGAAKAACQLENQTTHSKVT